MSEKDSYKIKITPLTGVHIGSGETLTMLDYKLAASITKGDKKVPFKTPKYLKFSSDKILKKVVESGNVQLQHQFEQAINLKDFSKLRNLLHENCTDFSDIEYPCEISPEFQELFNKNMNKDPLDNATEVIQIFRPLGSKTPFIPGSSLKGAIRTAYLNHILLDKMDDDSYDRLLDFVDTEKTKDKKNNGNYIKDIETTALNINKGKRTNVAQQDPFRCVEISDCQISAKQQLVGSLNNVHIDERTGELKTKSMQIFAELIPGILLASNYTSTFTIRLNKFLQSTTSEDFKINQKIKIEDIIKACNFFYKKQFDLEYTKFYEKPAIHISKILELKKIINSISVNNPTQFIIRVGRWSQVEYVTLGNDFRNPKVPVDRRTGREKGFGNTRTLLNYKDEYIPMGWCLCTLEQ